MGKPPPFPLLINFADAYCSGGGAISVAEGMESIQTAVDLMNNNQYREAVRLLKPQYVYPLCVTFTFDDLLPNTVPLNVIHRAEVSMYHAMAYASVLFLQAGFSMDQVHACTCTCDLIVCTSLLKFGC